MSDELFERPRTNQAEEIGEGEEPWRGVREVSEAFALLGYFVMVMDGDGCDGECECGEECGGWRGPGCWSRLGGIRHGGSWGIVRDERVMTCDELG